MSARVTKEPEARRVEILQTAFDLFTEIGFDRTSVQMITETVGVSKGLFYHYFQSKTDLLEQLVCWKADEFFDTLPKSPDELEGDALDKVRSTIDRIVGWKFGEFRKMTMAYIGVMYREENLALRTRLQEEYLARLMPLFAEILDEGVKEGVIDVPDSAMGSELVWSLWSGAGNRLAGSILALPQHPEKVDEVLQRAHAWEWGLERLLGIEEGTLKLYDWDYIEAAFREIAESLSEGEE
ncbi:MAG: TetR/AcrR family transcriptional regulator [Coriobacteriia bacterium]|nr:TetR/AcrR family transcriptional regulator [Coriobacteriia bacterium]